MKLIRINPQKLPRYVKTALTAVLLGVEILILAQTYWDMHAVAWITLAVCCVLLFTVEAVNELKVKNFVAKMVLYSVSAAILLVMCILAGNPTISVLFCIVLTSCYGALEDFRISTIVFGSGCAAFALAFIVGRIIGHPLSSAYKYAVESLSGILFGLFAMALDFVVVQFILKYSKTNKELSSALAEKERSQAQLEAAYEQLIKTRVYEERNRIAMDIHDNAGHSMTTVIMQTEAAKLLMDENPQEAKACIISANIQARNALEQMRESVHLLAGRENNKSLSEDMQLIIEQTMDGTGVRVRYDISDLHVPEDMQIFLCNALKELLSNGIRHGKATAFYVELANDGADMYLLVSDNGMGIKGKIKPGFGLKNINETCDSFGGRCLFSNENGEGLEVKIILPYLISEK